MTTEGWTSQREPLPILSGVADDDTPYVISVHSTETGRRYLCPWCAEPAEVANLSNLTIHIETWPAIDTDVCDGCGATFGPKPPAAETEVPR